MKYNRLTKHIANDEEAFLFHSSLHEGIERLAELEDKIEHGELVPAAEYESARHRAEVAERALLTACVNLIKDEEDKFNMELLALVVYTMFLRKAEKELAEEKRE